MGNVSCGLKGAFPESSNFICTECGGRRLVHRVVFNCTLWIEMILLTELSVVRTFSKYVLLANESANARKILFVNTRFVSLRLCYSWLGRRWVVFVSSILEDLSILELEVATRVRILSIETVTFICYSEWSRWPSFHNSRFIWFPRKQAITTNTTKLLFSFISIVLALLITRFRVESRCSLAIKRERIVPLNLVVLTRLLQVFIEGPFLRWYLLPCHSSHE